ncbi:hypothetical protein SI65_05941 [Aspergillus cristatus]|uniref:Uncharacterized protein n=1 Tax=Aspergillus cristatus TaxID=573508 RepID=A0A1E3BEC1_ASPCR|nr:hypothetical protein SI65_05941 [Aspergillus cristatus]
MTQDEALRRKFHLQGRVAFEDCANLEGSAETSLEEVVHVDSPSSRPQRRAAGNRRPKTGNNSQEAHSTRRRNRRADQFCVHIVAGERRIPAYAVQFKAPHKLTLAELIAGLHEMEPARHVIDRESDTFEFHAMHLVAAVITQIFSYMVDSGIQYGYICTGEAFVSLHIPNDPALVYYYLSVPNRDVQMDDEYRLH